MRSRLVSAAVAAAVLVPVAGCGGDGGSGVPTPTATRRITVTSPAFPDGGTIPRRHTCDGDDVSPPLALSGVPADATGLVVIAEDRDAPHGTFTHWLMWGVYPRLAELPAGEVPAGATVGRNDFRKNAYGGPCPPRGDRPHRYVFTVYAADRRLGLTPSATADDVRRVLAGHTLALGSLSGRYGR